MQGRNFRTPHPSRVLMVAGFRHDGRSSQSRKIVTASAAGGAKTLRVLRLVFGLRPVERRLIQIAPCIRIRPGFDQDRDDVGVSIADGVVKRRPAKTVHRIHIQPGLDERQHDLGVVVGSGGSVEGRPAVLTFRIRIRPGPDGIPVASRARRRCRRTRRWVRRTRTRQYGDRLWGDRPRAG